MLVVSAPGGPGQPVPWVAYGRDSQCGEEPGDFVSGERDLATRWRRAGGPGRGGARDLLQLRRRRGRPAHPARLGHRHSRGGPGRPQAGLRRRRPTDLADLADSPGVIRAADLATKAATSAPIEGRALYAVYHGMPAEKFGRIHHLPVVMLDLQREVLKGILTELQASARITSLHSYRATNELVELLESTPIEGAVLHWWLGDVAATKKAVELGAYFSINAANLKNREGLDQVPLDRIFTETDHPDGDRASVQPRQPGNVTKVETELARRYGITAADMRRTCWKNLRTLTESTRTQELLPPRVQAILLAASEQRVERARRSA